MRKHYRGIALLSYQLNNNWHIYTQLSLATSQNKHLISPNIFLTAERSKYNIPDDNHDINVHGIK